MFGLARNWAGCNMWIETERVMRIKYISIVSIALIGVVSLASLLGCTSIENRYSWDELHAAKIFGIDGCHVTAPLDDEAAIARIREDFYNASQESEDWKKIRNERIEGDEIRYVACTGTYIEDGKKLLSGATYIALVRQHRISDKVFIVIID